METRMHEVTWPSGRKTIEKQVLCSACGKWVHITSSGTLVSHVGNFKPVLCVESHTSVDKK